jgi:hypothetical protein
LLSTKEFLETWYDDKNHDPDAVSIGSWGGHGGTNYDNWSWYVSKSLYSHNANNKAAVVTSRLDSSDYACTVTLKTVAMFGNSRVIGSQCSI